MSSNTPNHGTTLSRRTFLAAGGAAAAATLHARSTGAQPNEGGPLRVGLIGCGGRGTGAARQALLADPDTVLVALGDVFQGQVDDSHQRLLNSEVADRVQVDDDHKFVGLDNFEGVIAASDVLVLAAPPFFRPRHLRAAIEAGCHVFCEKPVAVDPVGVRSVLESCELAKARGLNIVSGLCYRYQFAKQDTMQQIHDGAVGDILTIETNYITGVLWHKGRQPDDTEMAYQLRNWIYFCWLSGDHINEQHIHSLDKVAWAMGDVYPERCWSTGGRIQRTDPKYGNVYDHFNTTYEWANGVKAFSACRQWENAYTQVEDNVFGTNGVAQIQRHRIEPREGERWRHRQTGPDDMYQNEHNALFAAIRAGEPINDGDYMCKSTLMAIMGRMSAYTGQAVTWEEAMNSDLDLSPEVLTWGPAPQRPVAVPGTVA